MNELFYVVSEDTHNELVRAAYLHRGFNESEADYAAKFSAYATRHGIRTHNALKALHLDHLFGSQAGGCVPGAEIEKKPNRFTSSEVWNANRKLGQATAYEAIESCIQLAEKYGIGMVSVDNAFHYLWGGGYVLEAASRGYIAHTNCTAALAEVVPFMGKFPTLGTNPHSWAFPTKEAIGFDIVIDWATSVVAMGRVQQFLREGKELPENAAVDAEGNYTTDPSKVTALVPFGSHKGYGLSLINELFGGFIGGSLPTLRSRWAQSPEEKHTPNFFFMVIHPEALSGCDFIQSRTQMENVQKVIEDILGHGNEKCLLPGQLEAEFLKRCDQNDGLLFTQNELEAFNEIARECHMQEWSLESLKEAE